MSTHLTAEEQQQQQQEEQVPIHVGSPEHQEELQTVIQSVQDAASPHTALVAPTSISEEEVAGTQEVGEKGYEEVKEGAGKETEKEIASYWDASAMAPLNAASAAAIARLKAYKPPPFPLWDRLPLSRRSAVLLLLYADRRGDLRVVITMRAASLRSFSGHAALPGGKADTLEESPYQIARREAWEEIGLPLDDRKLPPPFRIEHLCYLPMNLARTELVVRPCVALLHTNDPPVPVGDPSTKTPSSAVAPTPATSPTVEESLIPRLDAKEVAAVFSAPFHNFLKETDEVVAVDNGEEVDSSHPGSGKRGRQQRPLPPGSWYEGTWTNWNESRWRMHFFYVPVTDQTVVKPRPASIQKDRPAAGALSEHDANSKSQAEGDTSKAVTTATATTTTNGEGERKLEEQAKAVVETEAEEPGRYKVWGMTARILVDAATVAYGEKPEFEHNRHFGDERMIEMLAKMGRMGEKKPGSMLTGDDLQKAWDAAREVDGKTEKGEPSKM
ncbi:uncharacterized protein C8A04DRAFT_24480 [Dichotomopilus funicola]|uniref:Nudix hydrolase domain-containing protein n=1 Tax=Dichotomopilus funicola TaxID=1934379 RepID=A0AAN6VAL6_9PEZI|nr:hypothetical protein C8A04DRAFT_24480 [Dichotomopilus funicola]